ncbi:MAG: cation diffusion facilitator family transporter [Endomicrobiales bacterium]
MKINLSGHDHGHGHGESRGHEHGYIHIAADNTLLDSQKGIRAVKWSFAALFLTAAIQGIVVLFSGSVALLADTIHNVGDAATAIPLWIAFTVARWKPDRRFTYGYGRVEDLAGMTVVAIILFSAVFAGYESVSRLLHPREIGNLWAVMFAATIGFIGNEAVAQFRIKTGREIGSAALVADGYHARVDGLTSLAVLFGALGVWAGFPLADPLIGLVITVMIFKIVWDSSRAVFLRVLDGVDPGVVDEIEHSVKHVIGVEGISEVRVRWVGHRLHAELNVAVRSNLTVEEGHMIAKEARHQLLHHLKYLSNATIHIDPSKYPGEQYHEIEHHHHGDLPEHSHKS